MDEKENWQRWPRIISLFAYETQGENAQMYQQPESFYFLHGSHAIWVDDDYTSWLAAKRSFSLDEILQGRWVKIGCNHTSRILRCLTGSKLKETELLSPKDTWEGTWTLEDGVLEFEVGGYSLVIVSAQDGLHSGVETGQNTVTYFKVIHLL